MPKALLGQADVPGNFGQAPSACGVDQLSWVTWDLVGGPLVSTSHPGHLRPVSECPRCPPAVLGDSRMCPRASGVNQRSPGFSDPGRWIAGLIIGPGLLGLVPEVP